MNVITYNGKEEKREDCVFIRGKYYHKERDCFFYNGIYFSPFSRYLVMDHETQKRVHTSAATVAFGVVGFSEKGEIQFGHFSSNISKNGDVFLPKEISNEEIAKVLSEKAVSLDKEATGISWSEEVVAMSSSSDRSLDDAIRRKGQPKDSRLMKCMDVWPFIERGYDVSTSADAVVKNEDIKLYDKTCSAVPFLTKSARNQYSFNLAYNSEVMMDVFQKAYDNIKIKPRDLTPFDFISKYFGDKTFGVEYESWDGRVPTFLAASSGLIPLRDGSLRHDNICGYEYASVVMSGSKGLATIKSQCNLLKDFTIFNERCSVHIHIGNIPRTGENLVKLYTAFRTIQDSMYSLYPDCLKRTSTFKQKDYCSPLPQLLPGGSVTENAVVSFLSDGTDKYSSFGKPHPKDSSAQHKWNVNSRYSIFNLNNFYYTERGTVECRVSTPTFNASKVVALLLINMLIVSNAINGVYFKTVEELINSSISEDSLKEWMLNYIAYRKSTLSGWTTAGSGVIYYETFQNDDEIGTGTRPLL